jgi:hypothetical protein
VGEKNSKKNGSEIMKQWLAAAPGKTHAHENESRPRTCPPKNLGQRQGLEKLKSKGANSKLHTQTAN